MGDTAIERWVRIIDRLSDHLDTSDVLAISAALQAGQRAERVLELRDAELLVARNDLTIEHRCRHHIGVLGAERHISGCPGCGEGGFA